MKIIKCLLIMVVVVMVTVSCSKEEEKYYNLDIRLDGCASGTVFRTILSGEKGVTSEYSQGSIVELLPTCSGYPFSHWSSPTPSLDGSVANPLQVLMDQDIEITAVFFNFVDN